VPLAQTYYLANDVPGALLIHPQAVADIRLLADRYERLAHYREGNNTGRLRHRHVQRRREAAYCRRNRPRRKCDDEGNPVSGELTLKLRPVMAATWRDFIPEGIRCTSASGRRVAES
jgi:hypothetical protein